MQQPIRLLLGSIFVASFFAMAGPISPAQAIEAPVNVAADPATGPATGPDLPSAPEPSFSADPAQQSPPAQGTQNQQTQPANPNQQPNAPSLGDLGFGQQQTQANPQLQAMLEKRTHMLKVHQKLGLFTLIPMAAAVITGPMAKTKGKDGEPIREPSSANLDAHAALGGVTAGMYFTTAYFAVFAPKVPGTKKRGPIRFHEALAFVHGPGMILTPILGAMAFQQENNGEKVHGIASAHGAVAWTTVAAYGAAIVSVSWPLKF